MSSPGIYRSELPLLGEEESRLCLDTGDNSQRLTSTRLHLLHAAFEAHAAGAPENIAVCFEHHQLSYGDLNARANQLAHRLIEIGVVPEARVAIYLERGITSIICVLAALKAGGAYVGLDAGHPSERTAFMIADSAPVVILTSSSLLPRLRPPVCRVEVIDTDLDPTQWPYDQCSAENIDPRALGLTPKNLAYIVYTSGSTGLPKGVMVEHGGVPSLFEGARPLGFDNDDVWSLFHSLSFDFSVWELWGALIHGGRIVIVPQGCARSPEEFYALICDRGITVLSQTPSVFRQLSAAQSRSAGEHRLRLIVFAGELLDLRSLSEWFARNDCLRTKVVNMYGSTESTVHATLRYIGVADVAQAAADNVCGLPMPGYSIYILDAQMRLVPFGAPGEIYIGGTNLVRGYLNRSDLTAERFVVDPFSIHPNARLYKTGDVGRWLSKADLQYLGRNDFQVKIRGFRVELGEIEARLAGCAGVSEAVVIAREDTPGDRRLVAYVVPMHEISKEAAGVHLLPNGRTVFHHNLGETEFLYREIFEMQTQMRHGITLREDACVFDVGANIGLFALYVGERCPRGRVYAFEPLPPIFETLRRNAALCEAETKVFCMGIADEERVAEFLYYPGNTIMSKLKRTADVEEDIAVVRKFMSDREAAAPDASTVGKGVEDLLQQRMRAETHTCRLRRLSDVIRDENVDRIDLLKIDVERAEWQVLKGIDAADWQKIESIVLEVHDRDQGGVEGKVRAISSFLTEKGYQVVGEEDEGVRGVGLHNLYAIRPSMSVAPAPVSPVPNVWRRQRFAKSVVTQEILRTYLQSKLPDYMIPAAIVLLDRMPLTQNGKIDRSAFPEPTLEAYASRVYEAPQGSTEQAVAVIWQDLLRVELVGRQDNFFELGGNSLLIVQMLERLRRADFAVEVRSALESPTLAVLAGTLKSQSLKLLATSPNLIPAGCDLITPPMLTLVELEPSQIERIVGTVPGGAKNVQDIYPLAPLQEGILFHHLLNERIGSAYVVPTLLELQSRAKLDAFIAALQGVIDRHDILRSAILWEYLPRPVQVVYRRATLVVEEFALELHRDPMAQLKERMRPEWQRLDLRIAPLLRLHVAADSRGPQWYALLQLHHIVCDDQSLEILVGEVMAHFDGRVGELSEPWAYRNHVIQALERVRAQDAEAFFRGKLATIVEPTAPFGLVDVRGDGTNIEEARQALKLGLARRLRAQGRRLRVSAATLFHAAWALVVSNTSGREEIVYGTVLMGRMRGCAEAQRTIGMFLNTLPLRLRLQGITVVELVKQTQEELVGLLNHEQASLAVAQRCSGISGAAPLFSTLLNYRHSAMKPEAEWAIGDAVQVIESKYWTNYPITLSVDDLGEGFTLTAQTDRRIDPERMMAYMQTAVQSLVEALEEAPRTPALMLSILPAGERQKVTELFNATAIAYPHDKLIHELFENQAERLPENIAVIHEDECLTYAQLNCRANRLARYLLEHGAQIGEFIPIVMQRSAQMLIAQLAVLKSGGVYVPVDPNLPPKRQAFLIRDCRARHVLADKPAKALLDLDDVQWIECGMVVDGESYFSEPNPHLEMQFPPPAYVMYTSGSTGVPKGVVVSHRAVNRLVINNGYMQLTPADCVAHCSNPAFDASTFEIWGALLNGARVLIIPQAVMQDVEHFAAMLNHGDVTVLWLTASLFKRYLETCSGLFSRLRYLIVGGEVVDPQAVRRVLRDGAPEHLLNGYGPTEGTTFSATFLMDSVGEDVSSLPIGRPIANTQIYILDERLQPLPIGVVGEIFIGGDGVAQGYLNRPELTAERFLPNSFARQASARMYRTGDLGRWRADGCIDYLGRRDFQLKLRGFRVELGEIEARLRTCAGVREAVVVARQDRAGDKCLVAYITQNNGIGPTIDELRTHVRAALPEYMIPSAFVIMDRLPLMSIGKLDRSALPAPEADAYTRRQYAAPQGETEQLLTGIWQQLLGMERLSRNDDFFELGGHSLLAMQLISRVRETFAVEVPLDIVFETRSIGALAARIEQARQKEWKTVGPALVSRARSGPVPLSFAQERLWFLEQFEQLGSTYNVSVAFRLDGRLNVEALERSICELERRHESLRTRIETTVEGDCVQVVLPPGRLRLRQLALRPLPQAERRAEAQSAIDAEASRPFDLTHPLIRVCLVRVSIDEHCLVIVMHHLISDGWSLGVLLQELKAVYAAYSSGKPSPLTEPSLQFADYALWQRQWLEQDVLARQLTYWRRQLSGMPSALQLPTDRPRPDTPSFNGASESFMISRVCTTALRDLSHRSGATLYMALLAGIQVVLSHWSGQRDVVMGSPIAGRTHSETEGLIGFFVNTLVLRTDVSGDPSFAELLKRVRAVTLGAYAHQNLPFEKIVAELQPQRDLSRQILFQATFMLQNMPSATLELAELQVSLLETKTTTSKFDLAIDCIETPDGLRGRVEYATDLFDALSIRRLIERFQALLVAAVQNPELPLAQLFAVCNSACAAPLVRGAAK
jgi:amino acid adenylation domain-containing protein/FkbM family methyltransferase